MFDDLTNTAAMTLKYFRHRARNVQVTLSSNGKCLNESNYANYGNTSKNASTEPKLLKKIFRSARWLRATFGSITKITTMRFKPQMRKS